MSDSIQVNISSEPLLASQCRHEFEILPSSGGLCLFDGMVRDTNHAKKVDYLVYESYEPLAVKELRRVCAEATERFKLDRATIKHRVGRIDIGESAVVILCSSAHRGDAFAGCRYIIDETKKRVPIWKKEFYQDGSYEWTRCLDH